MATINLTTTTKNLMATEFKEQMDGKFAYGGRATSVGHQFTSTQDFAAHASLRPHKSGNIELDTGYFASTDFLGRTKVFWSVSSNKVSMTNTFGFANGPFVVVYENVKQEQNKYFRDIMFMKEINDAQVYAEVLATYQVRSTELALVDPTDFGVVYVQNFEVSF